jgi:hypothetical protein
MVTRIGPRGPFIKSLTTSNFRTNIGASLTSNNFQTVVPKAPSGNTGGGPSPNSTSAPPSKPTK